MSIDIWTKIIVWSVHPHASYRWQWHFTLRRWC